MADTAEVKAAKAEAYKFALNRLKDMHPHEYRDLIREEFEKRGLEHRPRMTETEKAAAQVQALLDEFGPAVLPEGWHQHEQSDSDQGDE